MSLSFSQDTFCSAASTVPYELSQGQDDSFIEELNYVDSLYFQDTGSLDQSVIGNTNFEDNDGDDDDQVDTVYFHENEVDNFLDNHADGGVTSFTERPEDSLELKKQHTFINQGCGCIKFHGKPCSNVINIQEAIEFRQYCCELNNDELDLVIKSSLHNHRFSGGQTSSDKHKIKPRQTTTQLYFFKGVQICRKTFCFIHNVEKDKLQAIGKSLDEHGIKSRLHGNSGKLPHNALSFQDRKNIHQFLLQYAADNALPLPGRMPNHREAKVLLLPSDKRQADIHDVYLEQARYAGLREVSLSTFSRVWKELCPYIVLAKPATDLCGKCQKFSNNITNSGKLCETEKAELLKCYGEHLEKAKLQRDIYREKCLQSKETFQTLNTVEGSIPCSLDGKIHYSWDYAQQVHFPHHSQQVGPIYFLTPRKCNVFGVCCEGSARQIFYLADEGIAPGKGANTVVSYVHHYLSTYGIGETSAGFNFDNCGGQNKNNTVLWYGLWRILKGLHKEIEYNTMVAGHTKFSPDWHFGLWKAKWRFCDAETIEDISRTIDQSSKSGHNVSYIVGGPEPFPFFDWKTFFAAYFKPLKNISKYHMFRFSSSKPGVVFCRFYADSPEESYMLLKKGVTLPDSMPAKICSPGLDPCRQSYLYKTIREFCRSDDAKDKTCPKPCISKTGKKSCLQQRKKIKLN